MWTAVLLALATAACTRVRVATQVEPGVDLRVLETYELALPPGEYPGAPRYTMALGETINEEIDRQLAAKGYRKVKEGAQMRVSFRVRGTRQTRVVNAGDPDADFYREEDYILGAMAIDIKDRADGRKLWVGIGEVDLYEQTRRSKAATDAVRAILAELPSRN